MCLDELADFRVTKSYGWGVFLTKYGHLAQLCYHGRGPLVPVLEEVWQTDPNDYYLLTYYSGKLYKTGFHLFIKKKDALCYANGNMVRKVQFRNIVAKGRQCLPPTFSAKVNVIVVRERYVEKA